MSSSSIHYSPFTLYYSFVDQTQREFLLEIEEHVDKVFADLDELRSTKAEVGERRTAPGRKGRGLIDRLFRSVHTIKGSAASCGLEGLGQIAHGFESLLGEVRAGRVLIDNGILDTFEYATEALFESLTLAAAGVVEPPRGVLFERLQAAAGNKALDTSLPNEAAALLDNVPVELWRSLTEPEKQRLVTLLAEGNPLLVVGANFGIENFETQFTLLKEKLAELGEVVSTSPSADPDHPEQITFRVLYVCDADLQKLGAALVEFPSVSFKDVGSSAGEQRSIEAGTSPGVPFLDPTTSLSLANFVRTDLDKLDRLISATHELLSMTANVLESAVSAPPVTAVARAELQTLSEQIRTSFLGVEDELINLRLVSLGPILQRAMRAGKAAARLAGKQINFEIVGQQLRIDKVVADAISGPLIQLVRNAVDHGIENDEERLRAGKNSWGTVRIEAVSDGSQSRLRVVDDGRGIDPLVIAEAARELGIISDDSALDIDRSLRLIFRPGFTTLAAASDVSGRGVGLDIVETAAEQVGGELRVSSEPKHGTTFELRLPVTFGLITTNVVVSAGNRYCIPTSQTLGIDAIDLVDGASGANQLRQVSLRDLLGQPEVADDASSELHLITCQFLSDRAGIGTQEAKCLGIVVDRVEGPQEVLVRSLGRYAGRWYGIAGATELKDGTVALVLDLPRLLSSSA